MITSNFDPGIHSDSLAIVFNYHTRVSKPVKEKLYDELNQSKRCKRNDRSCIKQQELHVCTAKYIQLRVFHGLTDRTLEA